METRHEILIGAAEEMVGVQDGSIDLVVTSPPYPMIEMWDEGLAEQDPRIATALAEGAGEQAFELMHGLLDRVWAELARVVRPGGFVCVNVGDATRK
ncbi:MAG: site-specific DNA-methyltransferase, partial [Planctomycetes bacterium]|nr:site-specific DNA-methyltransferase [Planctomycetota bacterium]